MALDTRDKRSSAVMVSLPWRGHEPVADGTVGQADRQHTALMYSGIAADVPAPVATGYFLLPLLGVG